MITLSFAASTLTDFIGALDALQSRGIALSGASVSVPTVRPTTGENHPAVALYGEKQGKSKWKRTAEEIAAGMSQFDALRDRASKGDKLAIECLEACPEPEPEPLPDTTGVDTSAPSEPLF